MIEVMVVVALIAIAAGVVSLSLRDGSADRLEREAARLSALLESARAEARASALPVRWLLTPESSEHAFRFVGLPPSRKMPTQWLDSGVVARFDDNLTSLALGPEALIGAQGVQLQRAAGRSRPTMTPQRGFTLIEVMVALAIVAVTLAAGTRAAGSLIDNAERFDQVLAAHWCADNQLTNLRLARVLPGIGEADFSCDQLGRTYAGKVTTRPMANPNLRQVDASISDAAGHPLLTLTTVLARY